jgi:hypothetical protein
LSDSPRGGGRGGGSSFSMSSQCLWFSDTARNSIVSPETSFCCEQTNVDK